MSISKAGLQADLTEAIRGRDQVTAATLRMALTAITTEEAAGEHHALTDEQVLKVLAKEAKKRREAAAAYEQAGRSELAATELAELAVLEGYLPAQLDDAGIEALVAEAIAETGAGGMAQMGQVMKAVTAKVAGRADGGRVAAVVRAQLSR